MALRGLWTALAACLVFLSASTMARASASPMVCVVRVGRSVDDAVLERVRGQTSDLPLTVVRAPGPIESNVEAARASAYELARVHQARAVVWFEVAERGDIELFVLDAQERRLLLDHVGPESGSPSAMQEAASLIVRDVLQSLLEIEPSGAPLDGPPPDANGALPPPDEPFEQAARRITKRPQAASGAPAAGSTPKPWTLQTAVGGRVVLSNARPSFAVSHRLGVSRGPLEAGAAFALGATAVWTDPVASLLVRRHLVGAFVGAAWDLGDELTVALDVHAGAALFLRSTRPRVSYLHASPSRTNVHGFVGPEVRVTWGTWPRVSVGAGVDFVVAPPAFSYEGSAASAAGEVVLWPFQPYVSGSLELEPRRRGRR